MLAAERGPPGERYVISGATITRARGARHRHGGLRRPARRQDPARRGRERARARPSRGCSASAAQSRRSAARWSARCCTATATTARRPRGSSAWSTRRSQETFRRTIEWARARGPRHRLIRPEWVDHGRTTANGRFRMGHHDETDRRRRRPRERSSTSIPPSPSRRTTRASSRATTSTATRPRRSSSPTSRAASPRSRPAASATAASAPGAEELPEAPGEGGRAALQRGRRARARRATRSARPRGPRATSRCRAPSRRAAPRRPRPRPARARAARAGRRTACRPPAGCPSTCGGPARRVARAARDVLHEHLVLGDPRAVERHERRVEPAAGGARSTGRAIRDALLRGTPYGRVCSASTCVAPAASASRDRDRRRHPAVEVAAPADLDRRPARPRHPARGEDARPTARPACACREVDGCAVSTSTATQCSSAGAVDDLLVRRPRRVRRRGRARR